MAFTVSSSPSTVAILVLYRPGSVRISNEFFEELTEYLEIIALYTNVKSWLQVTWTSKSRGGTRPKLYRLLELLRSFDCIQHVSGPTHVDGGTLDHIYTRSDEIVDDLRVEPAGTLSDHGFITWSMKFTRPPPISSRKTVRGWKNMDRHAFRQALASSALCENAIPIDADAETLFGLYDSVFLELANRFAPTRTITVRQQPIAVWFDDECRRMRRLSRILEKRYRRSGDPGTVSRGCSRNGNDTVYIVWRRVSTGLRASRKAPPNQGSCGGSSRRSLEQTTSPPPRSTAPQHRSWWISSTRRSTTSETRPVVPSLRRDSHQRPPHLTASERMPWTRSEE